MFGILDERAPNSAQNGPTNCAAPLMSPLTMRRPRASSESLRSSPDRSQAWQRDCPRRQYNLGQERGHGLEELHEQRHLLDCAIDVEPLNRRKALATQEKAEQAAPETPEIWARREPPKNSAER